MLHVIEHMFIRQQIETLNLDAGDIVSLFFKFTTYNHVSSLSGLATGFIKDCTSSNMSLEKSSPN